MAKLNLKSFKLVKTDQYQNLVNKIDAQTAEIATATAFIKEIEKGNLESTSIENVDENSLTGSLVNMRNKMKQIAREEAERNWITEGLAKFSDILRSNDSDLTTLANQIISELVKYMGTNQGGLYLINDNGKEDIYIELIAAYAYNRRKFVEQKIRLGQGILGQAALEKDTVVLTDIPTNYVKITSGLGEALPRNIIIVPLKLEERVYGLVEIASFQTIKKHQIQFVEKLSENLASTIASAKNAERTQKLLHESQVQTEQLRSQEEEVRQNMEELAATQEEMQRVLSEVQKNEKAVNELINVSSDSIFTLDRDYKIINFNKAFSVGLGSLNVQKGFNLMSIFPPSEQASRKKLYGRAFAGETFEQIDYSDVTGKPSYFRAIHAPLYDIDGSINSIAIFASDITEMHNAKLAAEQAAEEARAQEEEIRQNMEELSATQEEIQRILNEVQKNEKEVSELLDVSTDSIMTIGLDYKLLRFNRVLVNSFPNFKIEKGFDIFNFFVTDEEKQNKKKIYEETFSGKSSESIDHIHVGDYDLYFRVIHSPIYDTEGKVTSIAIYASDITELYKAKAKAEQNEKEVNELISVSSDSILTIDRNYKIIRFNKAVEETLKGVEVKGLDILSILGADAAPRKKIYDQVFETGKPFEDLDQLVLNGVERISRVKYAPLFDANGKVVQIAIYASDITEVYKAKATAEQNEREITDLINASSDSIVIIDKDSKVLLYNKVFASSLKGFKVEKGFSTMQLYSPEKQKEKKESHRKVLAGETLESIETMMLDGKERHFRMKYAPLFGTDGKVSSIAAYVTDVTELLNAKRTAEQQMKEAQQQTEEVKAQQEEIRQNMEELQAIQEELSRKNTEMEKVRAIERERADAVIQSQKKNMQNIMLKFKQLEADYKRKIAELESKVSKK